MTLPLDQEASSNVTCDFSQHVTTYFTGNTYSVCLQIGVFGLENTFSMLSVSSCLNTKLASQVSSNSKCPVEGYNLQNWRL